MWVGPLVLCLSAVYVDMFTCGVHVWRRLHKAVLREEVGSEPSCSFSVPMWPSRLGMLEVGAYVGQNIGAGDSVDHMDVTCLGCSGNEACGCRVTLTL